MSDIKQVKVDTSDVLNIPAITFSGTKYSPILFLTGTEEEFQNLITYIEKGFKGHSTIKYLL